MEKMREKEEKSKLEIADNSEAPEPPSPAVKKSKKKPRKKRPYWIWVLSVFFLAIGLSLVFGVVSEIFLNGSGIVLAILIVLVFIVVAIVADMVATAVLSADETPFRAMASRKVRGGKEGLALIKNAPKISSICADVIGDVCGVLSGAAGASVLAFIVVNNASNFTNILIASLVSAIIAGLTIGGKALFKEYATKNASKIVLVLGKVLSIFARTPKTEKQTQKNKNTNKKLKNK